MDKITFFFKFGCWALYSGLYKPNKISIQKPHTPTNSGYWMMKKRFLHELTLPPANRLEKLKGVYKDYFSIRINDQWRIVFKWEKGHSSQVEIIDYH